LGGIPYSMHEMTRIKMMVIKSDGIIWLVGGNLFLL